MQSVAPANLDTRYFTALGANDFEVLCCDILARETKIIIADRYGRSGQKQRGIDVFAYAPSSGASTALECKCVQQIETQLIRSTLERFWKHHVYWKTRSVNRFVLCFACEIQDVGCHDILLDWVAQLRAVEIQFEFWSASTLRSKLSHLQLEVQSEKSVEIAEHSNHGPSPNATLDGLRRTHFAPLIRGVLERPDAATIAEEIAEYVHEGGFTQMDAVVGFTFAQRLLASDSLLKSWQLRRLLGICIGDLIVDSSSSRSERRAIDQLLDSCHRDPRAQVTLAIAVSAQPAAARRVSKTTLNHLSTSSHPQVHWQFAKTYGHVAGPLSSSSPSSSKVSELLLQLHDPWVRRRVLFTILQRDPLSAKSTLELLESASHAEDGTAHGIAFLQAVYEWLRRNRDLRVSPPPLKGTSDIWARVDNLSTSDVTEYPEFVRYLDFACLQLDSDAAGSREIVTGHSRSEGRYAVIRGWVRSALAGVPADRRKELVVSLLTTADEGARWALAAEIPSWLPTLPDSDCSYIMDALVSDQHAWVVREALSSLSVTSGYLSNNLAHRLALSAVGAITRLVAAGWDREDLLPPYLNYVSRFPAIASQTDWLTGLLNLPDISH